ncbi:LysR family transcriptional regulator [Paraclostridium ghonii]|uniref:DNA-binding transcriptional LysR family regulator n=1 Tax=Paraclostridium ghonii TaxID=29358 RepID=A0ABU0MYW3_9FIRM|nr:LysR family transcriptional regulator [Paeniclostridium ghonii]MDQ0556110.1 DNA-binding transcriptional LysR family regulator [Paeniclostridium ghonii]
MNIKEIIYFLEVVKERNFTKAANNLYISQPALSKAIKNLEKEVQAQLIERNTKKFKLTYEGEIFYENSKKSIDIINTELFKLQDSITNCRKMLTLGIPPVISSVYFTSAIAKFKQEHPDIDIHIVEEGANNIKCKVVDESIELGAVIFPVKEDSMVASEIVSGDVVLVISKDHPLSNRKSIDVKELKDERFIVFNENFMMHDKAINACKDSGFEPNIVMKISQWDFILEMVALNQGIAIMPKLIVQRYKMNGVNMIPISKPKIKWDIGFIVKKDKYMSKTLKLFVEYATDHIKREYGNQKEDN